MGARANHVGRTDVAGHTEPPDPRATAPPTRTAALLVRLLPVVLVLALGACTDAPSATLDDPRAATTPGATPAPEVAPAPDVDPAPDDEPAPTAPPAVSACDEDRRATLVAAVDAQLEAIARQDWAGALGHATDGFQADIDAERFEEIITEGFPVVADNRARDIGRCRTRGDQATLEVTVEDRDGTQQLLLYLFERGPEGWGIGGAAPATPGRQAPDDSGLTV